MTVLLLRHAVAGHGTDAPDDHLRPLDERGRRQADRLPDALAGYDVQRVLTSPYVRCRQTVEPLAGSLGLPIEERPELAEGSTAEDVLDLVRSLDGETAVLCTHGDVVSEVLGEESKKGSTWVLEVGQDGSLKRRDYIAAPA
jgi:8-oxo-(d)GTP phosphatase